jgi:methionyl-tRNA formyltransferase
LRASRLTMKLIFCGTPRFAVPTLEKLIHENFEIELVVTNPDEPAGRGYEPKTPPVKEIANRNRLLIFQPPKVGDQSAQTFITAFQPDAIVVVAYGHILPPWMIDLPPLGCINLHASLLPKYRGAAPIPWAIIKGERETGVTTMKIDRGMDTGEVLDARPEPIRDEDTAATLSERLSLIGADLIVETLRKLEGGEIRPQPQNSREATYAPILKKEDGRIDWSLSAEEIWRRVRGFNPWPGAHAKFRRKTLHIWKAAPSPESSQSFEPGTLLLEASRLKVACGSGLLVLHEVQLEGRKRLPALDFMNGARVKPGEKLEA